MTQVHQLSGGERHPCPHVQSESLALGIFSFGVFGLPQIGCDTRRFSRLSLILELLLSVFPYQMPSFKAADLGSDRTDNKSKPLKHQIAFGRPTWLCRHGERKP